MKNCLFGSDIELMIFDGRNNVLSALSLIEGRKQNPIPLKCGGAVQADNVNCELNTIPAETFEAFEKSWIEDVEETENHLKQLTNDDGLSLVAMPSYDFPEELLDNDEARMFGCDPDFNAYSLDKNEIDPTATLQSLRTTGAHIHVGVNDKEHEDILDDTWGRIRMIQGMDLFVGLPITCIDISPESTRRRNLYGKASAHRLTWYGAEYRALSSFPSSNRNIMEMIFELTQSCLRFVSTNGIREVNNAKFLPLACDIGFDVIQKAINEGKVKLAGEIFRNEIMQFASPKANELFEIIMRNLPTERKVLKGWR